MLRLLLQILLERLEFMNAIGIGIPRRAGSRTRSAHRGRRPSFPLLLQIRQRNCDDRCDAGASHPLEVARLYPIVLERHSEITFSTISTPVLRRNSSGDTPPIKTKT